MALSKREKHFKQQLENREIKPSPEAWDRLDAMLTVAEGGKEKPLYNWIYIAASLIGILVVAYFFFSKANPVQDIQKNEIVVRDSAESVQPVGVPANEILPVLPKSKSEIAEAEETKTEDMQLKSVAPLQKRAIAYQQPIQMPTKAVSEKLPIQSISNSGSAASPATAENAIALNDKTTNSASENGLAGQDKLDSGKGQTQNYNIKVNASLLLSEVDNQLQRSFREKVIRGIDMNYQAVKLALSNRNQQSSNNH